MLQDLRDNSKGVVSGILIGLLVIIFTLTGAEALFSRDASQRAVVEVNGDKISERDIARAIDAQKQQILARYGESVPAEFLTDEYLRGPVIENLIERQLLLQAATSAGLTVGDEALNQQILSTPQFQLENGSFDSNRYQMLLRNIGHTPSTYKRVLSDDTVINQLSAGVIDTSFVTPAEAEQIISLSFQTRDFSYVVLPAENVRSSVSVSDEEVQAYYESRPQEFTNPEQIAVDYIDLNVDDLMADIQISEAEVRRQYEQNLAAFVAAPERHAAHILIESNDQAVIAEVSEKLAAGEDFAELARTYSDDTGSSAQGGDLGFTTGDTFPTAFEEALATLSVGGVSGPVVTEAGTHFIKKLAERGTEAPDFEQERIALTNQLQRNYAENRFIDLLEKLRDRSYNADSLADVAEELGVPFENSGLFSRAGGTGLAASNQFISAAFSPRVLEDGDSSDVIELSSSRVVVLKKTDYKEAYLSPLNTVSEQIVATLREQKTRSLLAAQAARLKQDLAAGKSLADVAGEAGFEVLSSTNTSRNDASLDRDVLRHVFSMARPVDNRPVTDSVALSSGDYALIALEQITAGGAEIPAEQRDMIASQLGNIVGQGEYRSYQTLLRSNAKIKR